MQSGAIRIEGHADLGAGVAQLIKGARLRGSGIGRGQDSQGPGRPAVDPQGLHQGPDAAAADEGHHDIDAVGGLNFRPDLVANAGLTGCVRQQRRIEKWDERRRDRFRPAVGQTTYDAAQQLTHRHGPLGGQVTRRGHVPDHVDQAPGEIDAYRRSFTIVDRCNGPADDMRQVQRNSIGRLRRPQVIADGLEALAEPAQLRINRLGDEYFVETSVECQARPRSLDGTDIPFRWRST